MMASSVICLTQSARQMFSAVAHKRLGNVPHSAMSCESGAVIIHTYLLGFCVPCAGRRLVNKTVTPYVKGFVCCESRQ